MKTNASQPASQPASLKFGALVFNEHVTEAQQNLLRANKGLMEEVDHFEKSGSGFDVVINHDGSKDLDFKDELDVFVCSNQMVKTFQQDYLNNPIATRGWEVPNTYAMYVGRGSIIVNAEATKTAERIELIVKKLTASHNKLYEIFKTL